MNKRSIAFITGALLSMFMMLLSATAFGRDNVQQHSIAEAMETDTAKSFSSVQFYFGNQPHPDIKRRLGSYTTKRTTNAFGKGDYKSCQWAFLSALKTLSERTLTEGGNAVVNIESVTTGKTFAGTDEFICRAGNVITKVYLKGDVVLL